MRTTSVTAEAHRAFGQPGMAPRWTHGDKEGVGTAQSSSSRLWYTLRKGIVTEVYFPTPDRPQIRDLQYLMTDSATFFHEEKRDLLSHIESLDEAPGYSIKNSDPEGRYCLTKEVIVDPVLPCLLQRTNVLGDPEFLARLKLYVLCAPHINVAGWNNNARIVESVGRRFLVAERDGICVALGATVHLSRLSCGYVGASDGWTDLADNYQMDWQFTEAPAGNVALTGELDLSTTREFTLGLAVGFGLHHALTALLQSLGISYALQRRRYVAQWETAERPRLPLERWSGDDGQLYRASHRLLLAHEDKTYPGAFIASLSIPWGESKGDEDQGGYHLVWVRDLVHIATGLMAAGDLETPMRSLAYLATSQASDGGFPQNFHVNGRAFWSGVQLDEVALAVLLARHLYKAEHRFTDFDPYPLMLKAAGYLVCYGPVTEQDRWEEVSGYAPSTLAACIAALICAATSARQHLDERTALFLEDHADWLEAHVDQWTVTSDSRLLAGIQRHFVRVHPARHGDAQPDASPDDVPLTLPNRPPGTVSTFPAQTIVDAGFLELVRYGIRRADDPLIVDSLRVVDEILRVETPCGPCWHRYSYDGYGQRPDGGPYQGWGRGRAWPLLTGERGHYELAGGRCGQPYLQAMERFASGTKLLPEQVWDEADRPAIHLRLGGPTGSAMPLAWAHAEYIKLLRSVRDGEVFDRVPEVVERYVANSRSSRIRDIWSHHFPVHRIVSGGTLRIQARETFRLIWSIDGWATVVNTPSTPTSIDIFFVEVAIPPGLDGLMQFTFFWSDSGRWEGENHSISVSAT